MFCAFLAHPVAIFRLALVRAGLGLFLACSILWDLFAANRAIEWHHFRLPASLIEISPGRAWQTPAQNRRRRGDSTAQLYFPFPPFSGGCIRSSLAISRSCCCTLSLSPRFLDGTLSCGQALRLFLVFSLVCFVAGGLQLAVNVNLACAGWALLTWVIYVLAYTPLKKVSATNTAVGAVAGALPVLIGWSAVGVELDARALALFLILFLWQFPHFMAIAWLYRRDYGQAGYKMLTVVESSGRRAGWQAVLAALALIPVSIVPVLAVPGTLSVLYVAGAALLGLGQLALAALFWRQRTELRARLLLRASLVYLPTLLLMLMLTPF